MARAAPRTSRQRGGERGRGGGSQLHRVRTALAQRLGPLCNPTNMAAHAAVAAVLLVAEAVLCLLIIRRIPCAWVGCLCYLAAASLLPAHLAEPPTVNAVVWPSVRSNAWHVWQPNWQPLPGCRADTEIDWEAYMQEVGGYLQVRPSGCSCLRFIPSGCSVLCAFCGEVPWRRLPAGAALLVWRHVSG